MLCTYLPAPTKKRAPKKVQDRLHHLESLVKNMISEHGPAQSSGNGSAARDVQSIKVNNLTAPLPLPLSANDTPRCPRTAAKYASGQVILGTNEMTFVGATHWAAILDDVSLEQIKPRFVSQIHFAYYDIQIEQVKTYFDEEEDDDSVEVACPEPDHAGLTLGAWSNARKSDLIAALPPRPIVDRLISKYFRSYDPARRKSLLMTLNFMTEFLAQISYTDQHFKKR